ncbi:hypothetical protein H2200_003957 [Cladophialophora chaetospira]|uniref:F-box domain-containing protein n=1 Tax=Cladophialophora chaetospira TaxID=386627 RepID=A0AA38XF73_9EURO|nr:hypothetical protein H2200_003957 [Cladophialophora chaetospira]
MSATCEAPVPPQLDLGHLRIKERLKWSDLPAEVIENVMRYLGPAELKIYRHMDKKSSAEATRFLFDTLVFDDDLTRVKLHDMELALTSPNCSFSKHVKIVQQHSSGDWTLKKIMTSNRCLAPVEFSSRVLHFEDMKFFFSEASECYRELSWRLPRVQELELGFTFGPTCWSPGFKPNGLVRMEEQKDLTVAILHGFFPKLTNLTLNHVVAPRDKLLTFLKRHKASLRHLTFRELHLEMPMERDMGPYNVLTGTTQFLLLLREELTLDQICFRKRIWVHALVDRNPMGLLYLDIEHGIHDWRRYDRDGWPTVDPDGGEAVKKTESLRHNFQEYICHRGDLPWKRMQPYVRDILQGSMPSVNDCFVVQQETGNLQYIQVESDDTWRALPASVGLANPPNILQFLRIDILTRMTQRLLDLALGFCIGVAICIIWRHEIATCTRCAGEKLTARDPTTESFDQQHEVSQKPKTPRAHAHRHGATWKDLPLEVIGKIMRHQETRDVGQLRLVERRARYEGARVLFHTLDFTFVAPEVPERRLKRARGLARKNGTKDDIQSYVKHFDYARLTYPSTRNLAKLVAFFPKMRPSSVLLGSIAGGDAVDLFSGGRRVCQFLENVRRFRLVLADRPFQWAWPSPEVARGCRNWAYLIPLLNDLHFGFAFEPRCRLETFSDKPAQDQRKLVAAFLSNTFPRLTVLSLQSLVASDTDLLGFLRRHKQTLRQLTFWDLHLDVSEKVEEGNAAVHAVNVLMHIMRFFLLLRKEFKLEELRIRGGLHVCWKRGGKYGRHASLTVNMWDGDRADETYSSYVRRSNGKLRCMLEEYVCHRGDFPFRALRSHVDPITEGTITSLAEWFIIPNPPEEPIRLSLDSDESWVVTCSH